MIPSVHNPATFLSTLRMYHQPGHQNKQRDAAFIKTEKAFLGIFQLGLFETYQFLYHQCQNDHDFIHWIIKLKGEEFYHNATLTFNNWQDHLHGSDITPVKKVLNAEQRQFWEEQGYLKIEGLISDADCDAVTTLICKTLNIDLENPETWYSSHEQFQGLMLQVYQGAALEKIRKNLKIRAIFADLYNTNVIYPNCEKLSYNPPVTNQFSFRGSPIHWDIDFNLGPTFHIQGLLYLNDVPADRGPFTMIPGYHRQINTLLEQYGGPEQAMAALREQRLEQAVPGKKGDLVIWIESLPHAASANHSNLPRFVQYISFGK